MNDFLDAVVEANREIINLISSGRHSYLSQEVSLGEGGDMSRRVDLLAESIFIKYLKKFGNIYSEECGYMEGEDEFSIIIDPIDGSDNFASNLPYFGTSVALKRDDKTIFAVIVNLATGELFYKDKDRFKRGHIDTKIFRDVEKNRISKLGIFERSYRSKDIFDTLYSQGIKFRSPGAFALSLAYAHDVDFLIYQGAMRVYDVEAGLYMCEDLYRVVLNDILIISKDKEIFDRITELFKTEGERV